MPLVSVIIPCYNSARFLTETLESVFDQRLKDFEVILIDDGSTDETACLIQAFGAKVKAEFTSNRGASAARNRGTALAQGQFIQYLDADDLLRPDALEQRVSAAISNDADVVYSDWQVLKEGAEGQFYPEDVIDRRIEEIDADPQIALFTDFWAPPAALLYHRRIVEKIGCWNESLPIIQDARFLLDAALMGGQFVYVPGVQADYRVHQKDSLSRRNPTQFALDCFNNACQVENFWKVNGSITSERQRALEKVYGNTARFFFEHDRPQFYKILAKIRNLNPAYIPAHPNSLRLLSQWFGYERAEAIALKYRQIKKWFNV